MQQMQLIGVDATDPVESDKVRSVHATEFDCMPRAFPKGHETERRYALRELLAGQFAILPGIYQRIPGDSWFRVLKSSPCVVPWRSVCHCRAISALLQATTSAPQQLQAVTTNLRREGVLERTT